MKLSTAFILVCTSFSLPAFAGQAVVLPGSHRVILKSTAWESRDLAESNALVAIAQDPGLTDTNWGIARPTTPSGNIRESLIALNTTKLLPADPVPTTTIKKKVFDHYETVPATLEPVYRDVQVEAGSAAGY